MSKKDGNVLKHHVKFDTNGGDTPSWETDMVDGTTISSTTVPTRVNYVFTGWYTDGPQGTNVWNFTDPVKTDLNLTAHWDYKPAVVVKTITYMAGEGSFTVEGETKDRVTQSIVQGKNFGSTAPDVMPTKPNSSFTGWFTDQQCTMPVDNNTKVDNDLVVFAGYIDQRVNSTVQFITATGETLVGKSSVDVVNTSTWSDIKDQQPFAKKDGYTFQHWSLNKDDRSEEVPDNTEFTENTALYPYFEKIPTPSEVCNIHFNAKDGLVVGSDTLAVDISEESTSKTWGSIPKPEVKKDGCFLSHWEDADGNTLEDDTELTVAASTAPFEVYAVFDTQINSPIITFEAPDSISNYMWIGNTVFRAEASETGTAWASVPKPMVYKDATGTWYGGYTSDYYFTGWKAKINGELVAVPDPITQAMITIVPEFKEKTQISFVDKDDKPITVDPPIKVADTDKWGEIAKIQAPEVTDYVFAYWMGYSIDQEKYVEINDYTLMSKLDLTQPIKPHYIAASDCCKITFTNNAVYEDGTAYTGTFNGYWGTPTVGIALDEKTSWKSFNKPMVATKDTSGAEYTYSFVKWQINMGTDDEPDWTEINDTVKWKITGRAEGYKVRPVIEDKITISFDAGEGAFVGDEPEAGWQITISTSTKFEDMPRPTVEGKEESGVKYIFKCWALDAAGNQPVSNTKTFNANTTLYAIYDKPTVSTVVNYKLTDSQIAAGAKITSASTVGFNYLKTDSITFYQVAKATIDYPGYVVDFWTTTPSDDETEAAKGKLETTTVLSAGTTIVYPFFKVNDAYRKVTVKASEEYTIKSGATLFIKPGDVILNNITTDVEKEGGCELLGWKKEGSEDLLTISDKMPDQTDLVLVPVFGDPCKKRIKITNNGNTLIKMTSKEFDIQYGTKVSELIKDQIGENAPTWDGSDFVEWQILNADNTTSSITDDMLVKSDLTLVPKFTGESEFLETNLSYFYDDREGKKAWAGIVDYSGANLTIRYGGDTTLYTFPKSEFNYTIHFGRSLTEIPDYFMMGCINWNNNGKKLTLPTGTKGIGKCFLRGCTSFNQEIDLSGCVTGQAFHIGEQFMAGCYNFNQAMDLTHCGGNGNLYIDGCGAFMFDCQSLTSKVTFPSNGSTCTIYWETPGEPGAYGNTPDSYTLASSNKYAKLCQRIAYSNYPFNDVTGGPWRAIDHPE